MTDEQLTRRRGCWTYALIIVSVLMLVVVAGGLVGFWYAKKMFNEFTDPAPRPLPAVELSAGEMQQLKQRLDTFKDSIRRELPASPLTLSAAEINALIGSKPEFKALKGKLYVTLKGDQVHGQMSVPLDELNLPIFRGRYLNGEVAFDLSVRNGAVRLSPKTITVKGHPVPDVYMDSLRKQNLAQTLNDDPRATATLDRLEDVYVKDGQVVIVPRNP